jgi:hypothetical protein
MRAWVRSIGIGSVASIASVVSLALAAADCGSKGSGDDSAAVAGAGDTTGTAGAGTTPTAGASSGGGASSTGGAPATGGGTSGSTSIAGTGSSVGGSAAAATKSYNFDADLETWKVQYTSSGPLPGDAGTAPLIAPGDVMASWNNMDGDPATPVGALQLNIPYSTASQYVGAGISLASKVDLTGKIIHANIKVVSGLGTAADLMTNPGGAKLYAKSGPGYVYAAGTYTSVTVAGTWITITFDLADPSYVDKTNDAGMFDPSDIREIGIQLDTSGTSTTAAPAVDLIDTVWY